MVAQLGDDGDDYSITTFDDEANTAIAAGSPPFFGNFIPANPLSTFDGESAAGAWTFTIDDAYEEDSGTLNSWLVELESN
jgi:hypothetical protein